MGVGLQNFVRKPETDLLLTALSLNACFCCYFVYSLEDVTSLWHSPAIVDRRGTLASSLWKLVGGQGCRESVLKSETMKIVSIYLTSERRVNGYGLTGASKSMEVYPGGCGRV